MKALERAFGEALLLDPQGAEALRDLGWLSCTPMDSRVAGPHLEGYSHLDEDAAAAVVGNAASVGAGGRS